MKTIGITLKPYAYTPEAYAYEKYLSQHGWQVQLDYTLDPNNDINIYFMGLRPFWKKERGRAVEIHEYQSLSTPPYAKIKNYIKKTVNQKPVGRIFLNHIVHDGLQFSDNIPYIYRDMGVDDMFFQKPNQNPDFDIIYCGSVVGRVGLIDVLLNLAKEYKILVVGHVSDDMLSLLNKENITLVGRVDRKELPKLYRNARYGLNYTPDIYPFNVQTSTKTLEYLAAGLHVISNKYMWAENFFKEINYTPMWLDGNHVWFYESNYLPCKEIEYYSWDNVLNKSGLLNLLNEG